MSITTRLAKGSPLTFSEMDNNFLTLAGIINAGFNYSLDIGSVNNIAITLLSPPASYFDGMNFSTKILNTNTGTATLNVNGFGAKNVYDQYNVLMPANTLQAGQIYTFVYNSSLNSGVGGFNTYTANALTTPLAATTNNPATTVGNQLINLGSTTGATNVGYTSPSTGAVATTVAIRNNLILYAQDFGFLASNSAATNYTAFGTAITAAAGIKLQIPAGTYNITFSGLTGFSPPGNIIIEGHGKGSTVLNITMSNVGFPVCFAMGNNGLTIKDMTINIIQTATSSPSLILWNANNLNLLNCDLNGGMTNTGVTLNSTPSLIISPTSGTQQDCVVSGCDIHQWNYGFLKSNTQTSIQNRIKVLGCNFYNNYTGDCSFNSPKGSCTQIVVQGNTFHDPNGAGASINQYPIALASCNDVVIQSNVILGAFGSNGVGGIHIEENSQTIVVSNNTLELNGTSSYGIVLLDNNQGTGTYFSPNGITLAGNNINITGVQAGTIGIWSQVVNQPAQNISITGNTVRGAGIGYYDGNQIIQDIIVSNNVFDSCTYGIQAIDGGIRFQGNETSNCTNGVYGNTGNGSIVLQGHIFNQCTNNTLSQSQSRAFCIINPAFIFALQNPGASSNTYLKLGVATATDRIHGFITYSVWCPTAAADMVAAEDETTWTGTTFTTTNKVSYAPGAISCAPLIGGGAPANTFVLNFFSTSARTNVRVEARLNGIMVQNT